MDSGYSVINEGRTDVYLYQLKSAIGKLKPHHYLIKATEPKQRKMEPLTRFRFLILSRYAFFFTGIQTSLS